MQLYKVNFGSGTIAMYVMAGDIVKAAKIATNWGVTRKTEEFSLVPRETTLIADDCQILKED